METVFLYCAAIGGGLLVLMVVLMLIGGDTDVDGDVAPDADVADGPDASGVLFQLSLKTVVAFLTFFGLAGMAALDAGLAANTSLLVAVGAGAVAFVIVGYLLALLSKLQSQGNVDLRAAIGSAAKVYLRIPGESKGYGKVTVAVGGRTVTQKAVTKGAEIPTGAEVVIRGMAAPDTFEVSTPR